MTFSSLIFIIGFLPLFLLIYKIFPKQSSRNTTLLLFSILFYLFGGLRFLLLLVAEAWIGWIAALFIRKSKSKGTARGVLIFSVAAFLGVLGIFKYTGFLFSSLDHLFGLQLKSPIAALPLGISFYTFKLISYVADVYHRRVKAERNFLIFLTYVVCFHTIQQGPIVRYADMSDALQERIMDRRTFSMGMYRFALGLAKKAILSDPVGKLADQLLPASSGIASVSPASAVLGSLCFTLQMYLDFSAYSDMAIGLGEMIGFHYKENFDYPYIASSVKDFWRRWHISLSSFFRDYVYIPLGGNRRGFARQTVNLLIVWLLTGLWHGADWNFILWGLYYFVFICLENIVRAVRRTRNEQSTRKPSIFSLTAGKALRHIYTILVFNLGWVIFRFTDFGQLQSALSLLGRWYSGWKDAALQLTIRNNLFLLILCVLVSTPLFTNCSHRIEIWLQEKRISKNIYYAVRLLLACICFVLAICALAGATYHPFLYNQF
ncbi:MAG: MBOAT family protein [Eubacterium sp.]|nr:MBOAT family protein [Eubacterium sp.]